MSYLEGMFEADLFDEIRGMGDIPANANTIDHLEQYRSRFPGLTSLAALRSGGVTHFTVTLSPTHGSFVYYDATGAARGNQYLARPQSELSSEPVDPAKESTPYLAPLPGDGLLPSEPSSQQGPSGAERWLPWALVGGALAVGGGLIWAVSRRPRPVAANRRRARRRRSRRSR